MPQQDTMNRNWDFEVNLSGLVAPTGAAGLQLPKGFYKVQLTDLYINPDKNPNRVVIKMTVAEEPFVGVVRTTGLGVPKSADDKVRYYWRGLAESAGYTPQQLDNGQVTLGPTSFANKTAYIRYEPADEAAGKQWEQIDFLPPTEWAQQKQMFESSTPLVEAKAEPAASNTVTPTASAAAPKKGALSVDDLKRRLGQGQ